MTDETKLLVRLPSGIVGLDALMGGGMFVGGIYLVIGRPGLGKTILANQVSYAHAAAGGKVVYLTLLTESHARMIVTLETMTFFQPEAVGTSVHYISGFKSLEQEKLDGLLGLLRKILREHKATLLVIDGLVTAGALADTAVDLKRFIHELQALLEIIGCSALLLTGVDTDEGSNYAQRTMVDGLIGLSARRTGMHIVREIEIQKHRGSDHILGASFYEISDDGIRIYPRTEATFGLQRPVEPQKASKPTPTGIKGLDAMLRGGLPPCSTTMVLGTPGSGKTLLGLSFLAAGTGARETGLYFGFLESSPQIAAKAQSIGLALLHPAHGGVEIQWNATQEDLADRLADRLLESIRRKRVKRLFIDGLGGFERALVYRERLVPFLTSLTNELRRLGVTTLISEDTSGLQVPGIDARAEGVAAMMDGILFVRQVDSQAGQRRLLSILKLREGSYDSAARELEITARGLVVGASASSGRPRPRRGRPTAKSARSSHTKG